MKKKREIAWLLSFVMIFLAAASGMLLSVKAADTSVSFYLDIGAEDENDAPQHYGVSYQVVDSTGRDVSGSGYRGYISESSTADDKRINLTLDESYQIKIQVTNAGYSIKLDGNDVTNDGWDGGKTVSISDVKDKTIDFKLYHPGNGEPGPQPGEGDDFNGEVFFVWKGAGDALCVHKISGLENSATPEGFNIEYIPVSQVKDDITQEQFVIGNGDYYWVWGTQEQFILDNNTNYSAFKSAAEGIKDYEEKKGILIDPANAVNGNSTVCTNGDRVFRATIYDDTTYEGVAFSRNVNDYTYFPDFWDSIIFTNTVDVSGTSADAPAVYETFLDEPIIRLNKDDNSINAFTGIRALDVPDGAVIITGDEANGFNIKFGSNFFDNVVFEITTAAGSYYLEIARTAIKVRDTFGPDNTEDAQVIANVYYDETESYSDYEVYATIHYKDGSTSTRKMTVSEITDDGLGNPVAPGTYEMDGGQKLKYAGFSIAVDSDVVGVSFNALKNGALSGATYGGSYFGSGKGVYYDIETRRIIY